MVLCSVGCVQRVSEYLGVPAGKLHVSENNIVATDDPIKDRYLEGFSTIVQALVKSSHCPEMLGKDPETLALTRQWLEYAVLCVNYGDSPANTNKILKELNEDLRSRTYLTGTWKTVADVGLYYAIHSLMLGLTHQEKAKYINVSRWFDNIQQETELRRKLELVNFNLVHLYL